MAQYWFSSGGMIDIQGITITPNTSAKIQALCFFSGGVVQMKFVDISGDEYSNWANDDNYLIALVGHKLGMGQRIQPVSNLTDPSHPEPMPLPSYAFPSALSPAQLSPSTIGSKQQDDMRSVHNEADIAKITTLEEQMLEQTRQLQQMRQIMISKGMI